MFARSKYGGDCAAIEQICLHSLRNALQIYEDLLKRQNYFAIIACINYSFRNFAGGKQEAPANSSHTNMDKKSDIVQIVITPPTTLLDMQEHLERVKEDLTKKCHDKNKMSPWEVVDESMRTGRSIAEIAREHAVKNAYSFISIAKEKKTPDTEIKKTLCKTIDETGNKFYWQRKYYKELILNIKSELKLNFEEEYEEKLKHLDDVRPGEDTSFPTANTTTSDNDRQIDIEQLKTHFKAPFKKEGGGFEILLTMLMQGNNPKFFAMIASEIYNSKYFFKGDFPTFAKWYKEFCKLVQCKCVLSYKQNKLKPNRNQSAAFGFLHI